MRAWATAAAEGDLCGSKYDCPAFLYKCVVSVVGGNSSSTGATASSTASQHVCGCGQDDVYGYTHGCSTPTW